LIGIKIGDLEWHNGHYFVLFYQIWHLWGPVM